MTAAPSVVASVAELVQAIQDPKVRQIVVGAALTDVPALRLQPGQVLLVKAMTRH